MSDYRIKEHPILAVPPEPTVGFTWQGKALLARPGETIASALTTLRSISETLTSIRPFRSLVRRMLAGLRSPWNKCR